MARTYGYYKTLSWCLAFVPGGVGFLVILAVAFLLVVVPWNYLKPEPLKKLDKIKSKRTGCCSCSWSGLCSDTLKGVLQLTERCSHYLFENDSLKIQSSRKHGRIVIISGRTFKLSCGVLSSLVIYNCIVWGIIISVATNYLILQETPHCNDNYDCFTVSKDTVNSAQPLANCSEISDDGSIIMCYYIEARPEVAIALVGGFLKIVPPMVFYATTTLYLILLKDFHLSIKITINVMLFVFFFGALTAISVFTGLRLISYIYENEERAAQVIVFLLLCICFTCWPWYVFESAKVEEEPQEDRPDEGDHEMESQRSGSQQEAIDESDDDSKSPPGTNLLN